MNVSRISLGCVSTNSMPCFRESLHVCDVLVCIAEFLAMFKRFTTIAFRINGLLEVLSGNPREIHEESCRTFERKPSGIMNKFLMESI